MNDTGSAILIFSAKESKNGIPHSRYFRDEQVCQIFFQDAEQTFDIYNVNREVTIQSICALAALTVRKHGTEGKNAIGEADVEWIFASNRMND